MAYKVSELGGNTYGGQRSWIASYLRLTIRHISGVSPYAKQTKNSRP